MEFENIVKLTKSSKAFLALSIAFLFVMSSVVFRPVPVVAAPTQPSKPTLQSITFVDYAGSDASGVADLQAGKIDAYDFSLTPSASNSLGSSFNQYTAPAGLYGLYINPQNLSGTGQYNPFYFQKVRFALNYLVDRNYFAQTIEGGHFIPCVAAVCAEPEAIAIAGSLAPFSNVTYNFQFANETIYKTLTANGVQYVNHQYMWHGKPVTLGLFDRTDDPIRHTYMQYLNSQLQKVGFQTNLIPGTLSVAYNVVFGTDPSNATWVIYPASNSQIWGYTDSNAVNFYSAGYYEDLPASDSYGLNWVGGNDSTTQEPASTALYDKADTYAIPLLNANFSTVQQRWSLLANLTYYGILGATYMTLGTSLAPYAASSAVSGATPNFLQDPFANYQNYMTMSVSASGAAQAANNLKMGVRHITNGASNPVGGDNDAYGDNMQQAGALPIFAYGPSTGYEYSTGLTYKVNGNTPQTNIPVPTTAIFFNGTADKWQSVASGSMAADDITVNMAPYLSHTTWSDGQPVTLADILWQYIELGLTTAPGAPLLDKGGEHGLYSTEYGQVVGIHVINSTSLELYTTGTFYPDTNLAALGSIIDVVSPMGYSGYTNGLGMTPWQVYYAMNQVVSSGKAAFSTATATAQKVDWLSLLNPTDVGNVNSALSASGSTIPPELAQLQTMSGQTWVTSSTASAGYTAAMNFIATNGVGIISDGPFYVSQYSASTSPAFLVMKPNPGFNAGGIANPNLFAPPVVLTAQATIPPILSPGGSFTIKALQTADGAAASTATPAPGATVFAQLVLNGKTQFTSNQTADSNGQVTVKVPGSLPAGSYLLSIYVVSQTSKLVQPLVQSLTLTAGSTTTSTGSSTSSSSSTTGGSTTSSTSSTTSTTQSTTSTSSPTTSTSSSSSSIALSPSVLAGFAIVAALVIAVAIEAARRRGPRVNQPVGRI